jgi:hypothetical protein
MLNAASLGAFVSASLIGTFALPQDSDAPSLALPAGLPATLKGEEVRTTEVPANTHTSSTQETAALDRDAAGRTVVAWQSKRQEADGSYGIYARRFDAAGRALGDEVHVNLHAAGAQVRPAVGLASSGAAWFAWESYGQDGDRGGVIVRRFDPSLAHSTNEVLVDTERTGHQGEPAVAVDVSGRALVVWTGPAQDGADGSGRTVRARRFAPDGTPLGEPFALSTEGEHVDRFPTLAADTDGGFVVAWARTDLAGVPAGIVVRVVNTEGAVDGDELLVAEGSCVEATIDVNAAGEALVGWMAAREGNYVPELRLVRGRELGPVRAFAPEGPGHVSGFGVDLRADGSALIAFSQFGDERKRAGLFALELDAKLEAGGEPFRVTAASAGHQKLGVGSARRLRSADDGSVAFAWDGALPGGDSKGVNLTLLVPGAEGEAVARSAPADPVELEVEGAEPHEPPVFTGEVDLSAFLAAESLGGPDYGFPAITQTSLTPPDPHIAAGPDHVVCIVNGVISFYTKAGALTFSADTDGGSGFWASAGANGFIFDPEVLYDPHSDRFMAMMNERSGDGYFLLAVSDDSNPNGPWFKYRLNATNFVNDTDIDSPNFAVDDTAVYLTADFFGPDKFLIQMVDKAAVLVGAPNPTQTALVITGQQSIGVPVTYDAGAPAQYMIEAFENFSNTQVRLHAITDPLGTPQRQTIDIDVQTYEQPENPPQLGTSIQPETFESRFWNCMYRNGSLWATHHVNSTQVRQRWYEIDMAGWPTSGNTPTVVQGGEIVPGEGVRTFFGSIWADDDGNAGMVFARSSPSEFISMSRAFRKASDPLGTMTPAQFMKQSTESSFSGRWGDYSNVVSDPTAPGAFWGYHEYRAGGIWSTWVGLMGPCATPTPYCTAKTTSIASVPSIGSTGEASVSVNDLEITMTGGLPGKNGIMFWGLTPGAVPFMGGTKCVLAPTKRTPLFTFDGSGNVSNPVSVTLDDLGETRYYQFWFRDPMHTDGTTVGLSDAIGFTVCP